MEFIIAGVVTGFAVLVALRLFFAFRLEAKNAEYLSDQLLDAIGDLLEERLAHVFWKVQADSANRQLSEAYADLEVVRTEAEEAESALEAENHQREVSEGLVDELEVALRFTLADLEAAEETIEELEEESDDLEESANDALEGWAQADALSETTLAWGERVLGLLEQAEGERL